MRIFILLFMLAPLFLWGQYPDNPRKLRLGFQTTGAGLTYIKDGAPAHTPGDDEDAWMVLDTANNVLYYWDETAGAWENILDDITQDTVFQITNVPDTTTLAPMQGDAFINASADTLGLYNGDYWVLFFGGSGGGAVSDTTRFFVYAPAHGLEDSISAYGYVPVKADFTKANSSTLDSTHFAYAVGAPHVDTLELKLSGPLVVTAHGLIVGRLYYLQDDGTQAVTPGTVRAPTVYVLDANTVVLTEVGADQDQVISRQAVPSPVFTFWGGDPQNPSDSIMQIVVDSVFAPAGLAKPSTIFFMSYSSQSKNPTYQDDSPTDSPLNPSHSWFYDGNVVTRMNHLLTSVDLQATSAGLFTLDTVMLVGGIPTDSTVADWLDTNYVQNNLRLPNGAVLYWQGEGNPQSPDYSWMVVDDITNTGESNNYKRILKRLRSPVDSTIYATRTYADSLFIVADSLRAEGDKSAPILVPVFDRNTQLDGCSTAENIYTGFLLIDNEAIDEGSITFEVNASPATVTYDVYNADSTSYYFETSASRGAGVYFWEVSYTDADGNNVGDTNAFDVVAGTPDSVLTVVQDSILVLRVCGVEISRDTLPEGNPGTVTSVALSLPGEFAVSGSPVTSSGNLSGTWNTQAANTVLAGPASGGAAAPTFRSLVAADITAGGGVTGSGVANQYAYFSGPSTLASDDILNIGNTYSSLGGSIEIGADVVDDRAALNIVGTNILLGANESSSANHWESNSRSGAGPKIAAIKMPKHNGGYLGLFFGYSSSSPGNYIYFGGNQTFGGPNLGVEPDRMYFKTSGGSGYSDVLIYSGKLRIGISSASDVPAYSLDIGGTAAMRLNPSSAPVNAAGVWYAATSNCPHFMDGTTDWPLVRGAAESFTTGSVLFAGTSGQAQQDNANLFFDDAFNRVHIGGNSPQRTLHVTGEVRITDLTTDTPTRIVGADADGDLGEMTAGTGISFAGGQISSTSILTENDTIYVCNDTCGYASLNQALEYASQFTSPYDSVTGVKTIHIWVTRNSDGTKTELIDGVNIRGGNFSNIVFTTGNDTVLFNPVSSQDFFYIENASNLRFENFNVRNIGSGSNGFQFESTTVARLINVQIDSFDARGLAFNRSGSLYWQGGGINQTGSNALDFSGSLGQLRDVFITNITGAGAVVSRNSYVQIRDSRISDCTTSTVSVQEGAFCSLDQDTDVRNDGATESSTDDVVLSGGVCIATDAVLGGFNIPIGVVTNAGIVISQNESNYNFQEGAVGSRPAVGGTTRYWYNTTDNALEVSNGVEWVNAVPIEYTPSSTADSYGSEGDITYDDDYIYIKTSAGWKRSALSTF